MTRPYYPANDNAGVATLHRWQLPEAGYIFGPVRHVATSLKNAFALYRVRFLAGQAIITLPAGMPHPEATQLAQAIAKQPPKSRPGPKLAFDAVTGSAS